MKAVHPEVVAVPRINPGETLRKAREGRGLTIAEVALQLNLTPQRLNQVEQGAFDKLPGHTFARGYVRSYAKLLELDQNRLVLEFDQFTGSDAVGSNVHSLGRIEEPVSYSQRILRMVSFVLLLALAGLSFFWWQEQAERRELDLASTSLEHVVVDGADGTTQIHPLDELEDQAVDAALADSEVALPLMAEETAQPVLGAPIAEAAESAQAQSDAASAPLVPDAEVQPATPESVVAASSEAAPLQAAAGEAVIDITFIADCWTQLTDANGSVLFSALKRKGDTLQLAGKAPLELRLGYARGAQVSVNGSPVDVAPFISGETARLKLGGQ